MIPMQYVVLFALIVVLICLFKMVGLFKKQQDSKKKARIKVKIGATAVISAVLAVLTILNFIH
ncbi:MAG: hypothetical protein ABF904_09210 [Ethanoligenens sp.]